MHGTNAINLYITLMVGRMSAAVVLFYTHIHFNIIVSSSMAFTLVEKYQCTTKQKRSLSKFKVLAATTMKTPAFRYATPCSLVQKYQHFGEKLLSCRRR